MVPRRKRLSQDLRDVLVYMRVAAGKTVKAISISTGIAEGTVYQILQIWKETGGASRQKLPNQGRPRALEYADTEVCRAHIDICSMWSNLVPSSSCAAC